MPNEQRAWHTLSVEETFAALESDTQGLSDEEAVTRLEVHGPNELPTEPRASLILLFLKQFHSALIYILLGAALVSFLSGHPFDAAAIIVIVLVNGIIGYAQERKAEAALAKLKEMVVLVVSVKRADRVVRVEASRLVPGDIVLVAEGGRVPADLRIVTAVDLRADESALTGESVPSAKLLVPSALEAAQGDRKSMLFMGTLVTSGEGVGVVVETGERTVFGAIARSLSVIKRERTPLERRVDRLGRTLAIAAIVFSGLIFVIGILRGLEPFEMFLTAVAMAVSSIPEGLPAVLAVVLAVGVQRMARRNAVTRRLPAVETLGVVDVICTDKTGTLTENQMTARAVVTLAHDVHVTGEGWEPKGEFRMNGEKMMISDHPSLMHLLRVAALCNKAEVILQDGRWIANGDPTEAALVALGAKAGYEKHDLARSESTIDEIPFSSDRKFRAILHDYAGPDDQPRREIMVVGAFEVLLSKTSSVIESGNEHPLTETTVSRLEKANAEMAAKAMRILAVAVKRVDASQTELREDDLKDMTMLGLIGMIDPPRKGVADAIAACHKAGIRVIMNTGDHRETAVAIAREVGILGAEEEVEGRVFTDSEVAAMDDARLREVLVRAAVFARVSPQTKVRVVAVLKALGHTVAMTGDGINDAPALKSADIGVAMGIAGTDVTKEVAEMVLTDDNFVSIVSAVEEGRIVYRNVKQTVAYLVTTNVGEVVTILASLAIGMPLPLLPAQILWLNLATDGFTGVALAAEKRHGDELAHPPRSKNDRILSKNLLIITIATAVLMAAGTLILFEWALGINGIERARTVAFLSMVFFQLWNVFSMRSVADSIFTLGWRTNKWIVRGATLSVVLVAALIYVPTLQDVFGLAAVGWKEWALAIGVSSSVLWAVEGYKIFIRRGLIPARWL